MQRKAAQWARRLSLTVEEGWVNDGERAQAGGLVSQDTILRVSAAWACLNLIAGTISSLPLIVYRNGADGSRRVAGDHALYRLLHDSPNADQTALDFWEYMSVAVELRGNAYAEIVRSGPRVVALVPIQPESVTVRRNESGQLQYEWTQDGRFRKEFEDRVLHLRGFGGGPLGGLSTISYGRETFGLAQAMASSASAMYTNALQPSGVLTFEKWLSDEQRGITKTQLAQKALAARHAPLVLEGGTKWQPISITPLDAQLLESRGFSVNEICRIFGVPPHMIGQTEKSTSWGTGIEQQTLGFVKYTLRRRLKRIEQALHKQLLTPAERDSITIEFNLEGLLRGDSRGRAEFYRSMTQIGAMTINEVRALENMPPVAGGDVPRMQAQNKPIGDIAGIDNIDDDAREPNR